MPISKKPQILAVDDKRANLITLDAVLSDQFELVFAESGAQALAQLKAHPDIALILLDVQMPVMDGFETAARIKALPGGSDIPIVFITAVYVGDPFIERGYAAGGIDYFSKPFDPKLLRMKVGAYTSFRQKAELLKAREEALRRSEELERVGRRLSTMFDSLRVGVMIADREGAICQTTDEAERVLKALDPTRQDRYGSLLEWWKASGQKLKGEGGPLQLALREGRSSQNVRVSLTALDGTPKTILVSASPLRGLDMDILGAVLVVHDVTEFTPIEADLEQRISTLISAGIELDRTAHPSP